MNCPGSVRLTHGAPDDANVNSAEGTVLHEIAADCLEFGFEPEHFIGETYSADGFSFEITESRAAMIIKHLDWLREQPGKVFVETRVNLGRWMPGQGGTLDVGIVSDDLITIADWKFGRDPVSATWNKQLLLYAAGFWWQIARHLTKATRFRIVIMQPNARSQDTEFYIDLDDLLPFMDTVADAAKLTYKADAPIVPGIKQCKWCPAARAVGGKGCAAQDKFMADLLGQQFEDLDDDEIEMPSTSTLTRERLVTIWKHEGVIRKWLDAIAAWLLSEAIRGSPVPGTKMVSGDQGHRKWANAAEAEGILVASLADQALNKSLKSPTQIGDLIAPTKKKADASELWQSLQDLIVRDPGKPKLVVDTDPRPALPSLKDQFEDL